LTELRKYDGTGGNPIYVGIRGNVYDVTRKGAGFYGPEGGYHLFAGREAARALAKGSLEQEEADNPDYSQLTLSELDALQSWESRFQDKYDHIGFVVADDNAKKAKLVEIAK
jgi:membrane-associated progesterone receptor component